MRNVQKLASALVAGRGAPTGACNRLAIATRTILEARVALIGVFSFAQGTRLTSLIITS